MSNENANERIIDTRNWSIRDMIEVKLIDPQSFLKIKETLTRIGTPDYDHPQTVYQLCHVLHKRGRYFVVHYKEMYALDQQTAKLLYSDIAKRNTIIDLLEQWGLITTDPTADIHPLSDLSEIKIVPHKDKKKYTLVAKYQFHSDQN